jgi:hypothetical protein
MPSFRTYASHSFFGSALLACVPSVAAASSDYERTQFVSNASRCSAYGPDFAAVEGSDRCMRIGGHVRVQLGTNAGLRPGSSWSTGSASSATLRSDSADPRTGAPTHLRVRGGLEYPNPFR